MFGVFRVLLVATYILSSNDSRRQSATNTHYLRLSSRRYKTVGTTQARVTRKKLVDQLGKFQENDGEKKLMLVHDETSGSGSAEDEETSRRDDNITGMDFPKLEAVVSIGSENRSQRVGRLCRMSRLFMPENDRDAVYVELSGV